MWFLLMVMLSDSTASQKVTVLNTFEEEGKCRTERRRIGFAMAESYPHEANFKIVCKFRRTEV